MVCLLLYIPYLLAVIFILIWMCSDNKNSRKRLPTAGWLAFASIIALYIWAICYIYGFNQGKYVHIGTGDKEDGSNYQKQTKLYTLMWYMISGILLVGVILYFIFFVQDDYLSLYPEEEKKKEEDKKEEEKKAAA